MLNGKPMRKCNSVLEIKTMNNTFGFTHSKSSFLQKKTMDLNANSFRSTGSNKLMKRDQSERDINVKGYMDYFSGNSKYMNSFMKGIDSPKKNSLKMTLFNNETRMNSTFTDFMKTTDFRQLSACYQEGHLLEKRKKVLNEMYEQHATGLTYRPEKHAKYELLKKYDLIPTITPKEKESHDLKNNTFAKVTENGPQFYRDQFDSYQVIKTNKCLHDHLLLKTNEEQIKALFIKQYEIEKMKSRISLMPDIKPVCLQTKKKNMDYETSLRSKQMIHNLSEIGSIMRKNLFVLYNGLYISSISKYNCTPTSRADTKMINYYSNKTHEHKLYIYGGMNIGRLDEIWECTISDKSYTNKYQWKKIIPQGERQLSRSGHTVCYYKNELVIYGGIVESTYIKEDILFYSVEQNSFFPENCSNKANVAWRKYHIAEIIGTHMFIHGGVDEAGNILNDSWALDLTKRRWMSAKLNCNFNLPYLHSHSSCQVFSSYKMDNPKFSLFKMTTDKNDFVLSLITIEGIYLFGGIDNDGQCSNNLYVINGKPLTLHKIDAKGTPPSPRCSFTMNLFDRLNVLIIHGGKNERDISGPYFNDFHFLDLQLLQWYKMDTNEIPQFRGGHCSVINENELIIFGGINDKHFLKSDLFIVNLDIIENYHLIKKYKKKQKRKMQNDLNKSINDINTNATPIPTPVTNFRASINTVKDKLSVFPGNDNMNDQMPSFFHRYPKSKEELQKRMDEMKSNMLYSSVNKKGMLYKNKGKKNTKE